MKNERPSFWNTLRKSINNRIEAANTDADARRQEAEEDSLAELEASYLSQYPLSEHVIAEHISKTSVTPSLTQPISRETLRIVRPRSIDDISRIADEGSIARWDQMIEAFGDERATDIHLRGLGSARAFWKEKLEADDTYAMQRGGRICINSITSQIDALTKEPQNPQEPPLS